jgi:crotonobetainyl-CoA:carnitine CoA-transferase CaiB-like acyl-CoA transferase
VLTALHHRQHTGQGQFIDLSQMECLLPLAAHGILQQATTGTAPRRQGNDRSDVCPHGVYACAGDDEWILIQVFTEPAWLALRTLAALDFGDLADRRARRTELDAALGAWTRRQDARLLMATLQGGGVTAARVQAAADLLSDPQLTGRRFWQTRERVHVGEQPHPSAPYRLADEPIPIITPAPTLGQHNAEVLQGLLGLDDALFDELARCGVIGNKPRMPTSRPG